MPGFTKELGSIRRWTAIMTDQPLGVVCANRISMKYHNGPIDPDVDRFSFRITKNEADFLLGLLRSPQDTTELQT
jgi:hypothetical protein